MDPVLLDEFARECGLNQPFRVEVSLKGDLATQVHEFRQPFLLIGRRGGSDLLLDHWLVSRRHAYLQLIEGRFYCVDLGSRTGTHGGDATERSGWVDPIRALQIGPYAVRPELPSSLDSTNPSLPIVTWSIPNRVGGPAHWTMNRGLALVGRSPACKIRIPEADVSRFHCGLVLTPTGVWVIDLLSQRPIRVNGQTVRFARLGPGDELQLGKHVLVPDYNLASSTAGPVRSYPFPPPESRSNAASSPLPDPEVDQLPALKPTVMIPAQLWNSPDSIGMPDGLGSLGIDPTVNHLIQQFGSMQQQMFDQFHQSMMMMFEGFAALHRETSASIRQEMDEVRRLSEEIDTLRVETARLAEATTMSFQAPAFFKSDPNQPPPALNGNGNGKPTEPATESAPAPKIPPRVVPEAPDASHGDIHAQLCERLNSMASERQSRWQKILGMMAKA